MRRVIRSSLSILLLLSGSTLLSDNCAPKTSLLLRSQGANTARELVDWQWDINLPNQCESYASAYYSVEYSSTFDGVSLATSMFGSPTLYFAGSQSGMSNNGQYLIAENFGLARDFVGSINFAPRIRNIIFDFGFYLSLDTVCEGLYFRSHMPFVQSRWSLQGGLPSSCASSCSESSTVNPPAGTSYLPGFVSENVAVPFQTIQAALTGVGGVGDIRAWDKGKFYFEELFVGGLADIDLILGYNFINNDCGRFGLYLQAVMPTGTKPDAEYVFQPIIGNGKHFEFGGGVSAQALIWQCENRSLGFFLEGNVTHMFSDRQCRLFDFKSSSGSLDMVYSRYLLTKEFSKSGDTYTYTGNLINSVNLTNRMADVTVSVKGDASIKFSYRDCGFGMDIGYNVYGQSAESLCNVSEVPCALECTGRTLNNHYAVKGNAEAYGAQYTIYNDAGNISYIAGSGTVTPAGSTAPTGCPTLPAVLNTSIVGTNSSASTGTTAFNQASGVRTYPATDLLVTGQQNVKNDICNLTLSLNSTPLSVNATMQVSLLGTGTNPAITSYATLAPVLLDLSVDNLNISSAASPGILSHKFFGHLNYSWDDGCGTFPHIGLGVEAEFTPCNNTQVPNKVFTDSNNVNCSSKDCRINYNVWGIWLKGGFSF